MKKGKKIGIIGGGFVGSAAAFGFGSSNIVDFDIKVYDKDPHKSSHSLQETVLDSDFIFLCVGTPSLKDGTIDLSQIDEAFSEIVSLGDLSEKIFIIKSTVVPGTCRHFCKKYQLPVVSNPEFLTERRAKWDFINAAQVVIGSDDGLSGDRVRDLYRQRFTNMKYIMVDTITSEFIKYMLNCYFSVKVSFMNEMRQISDSMGISWEDAVGAFVSDSRIGDSHVQVPGPDGKFGFGGHCFPKDINAMIHFAKNLNLKPTVLEAAWSKNLEVREKSKV